MPRITHEFLHTEDHAEQFGELGGGERERERERREEGKALFTQPRCRGHSSTRWPMRSVQVAAAAEAAAAAAVVAVPPYLRLSSRTEKKKERKSKKAAKATPGQKIRGN